MGDGSFLLYMLPVFAAILLIRYFRPRGIGFPFVPERLGLSPIKWLIGKLVVLLLFALIFVLPILEAKAGEPRQRSIRPFDISSMIKKGYCKREIQFHGGVESVQFTSCQSGLTVSFHIRERKIVGWTSTSGKTASYFYTTDRDFKPYMVRVISNGRIADSFNPRLFAGISAVNKSLSRSTSGDSSQMPMYVSPEDDLGDDIALLWQEWSEGLHDNDPLWSQEFGNLICGPEVVLCLPCLAACEMAGRDALQDCSSLTGNALQICRNNNARDRIVCGLICL